MRGICLSDLLVLRLWPWAPIARIAVRKPSRSLVFTGGGSDEEETRHQQRLLRVGMCRAVRRAPVFAVFADLAHVRPSWRTLSSQARVLRVFAGESRINCLSVAGGDRETRHFSTREAIRVVAKR